MSDRAWVGIDLGTQSVRVVAIGDSGERLAAASRPLDSNRVGNQHEQDPNQWWDAAAACLSQVTAALPPTLGITALAVSGTSGTVCAVDDVGRPISTGIMYDDARAAPLVGRVNDAGAAVWARLGYRMQGSWALPAILWMVNSGMLPPGTLVAHQPDVVTAALAGRRVASDSSHALKSGVDLDTGRETGNLEWPADVMATLGVPLSVLPEVRESGRSIGTVSAVAAARTGLPAGCAIVAGMTDGCAAQLSSATLTPGSWNSVLGTTLVIKGVSSVRHPDPTGALYSHRAPLGMGWFPGGASSVGAGALSRWLPGRDLDSLAPETLRTAEISYPLVNTGERFPFVAAMAHGFFGESDEPPKPDAAAFATIALGVAHTERLSYDLLALCGYDLSGTTSFTGGGSRNPWWNQLRCDVLGRPILVPDESEGAVGMAVLAAAAMDDSAPASARLPAASTRLLGSGVMLVPSTSRAEIDDRYREFVGELEHRGWLPSELAAYARTAA